MHNSHASHDKQSPAPAAALAAIIGLSYLGFVTAFLAHVI
jgi:hypothetical protein